jgi:undecaprenyl diphosphate synthase
MALPMHNNMPHHVAIVMDGNGRWAAKRFLPRIAGHKQGVAALRRCVKACLDRGIGVLTVFAFSSENWSRPPDEVSGLMELLARAVVSEVPELQDAGVQLHFVGDRLRLSGNMQDALAAAESSTVSNSGLVLNVCFNYGGRWDIAQAAQKVAHSGQAMTEHALDRALALAHVPDPDLLIRTGGELRISNFLLWQAAYAELHFTDKLWPEFDELSLDEAIAVFQQRERRFGQTPDQIIAAQTRGLTLPSDESIKAA